MDPLTPPQRSERMSRVRAKGSDAERLARSLTHGLGYRFHGAHLTGKPDLVFPARRNLSLIPRLFPASAARSGLPAGETAQITAGVPDTQAGGESRAGQGSNCLIK